MTNKTHKIYGGKFRRWLANNIGHYVCPYPLVRDRNGRCTRKAARSKKNLENVFTNVGVTFDPYKSRSRSMSMSRSRSKTRTMSRR